MITKYLLLLPVNFIVSILGRLLNPVVVLFANDDGWLPKWLWWFQTPDNSLDGDFGWQMQHLWKAPRYINRVRWLMRNCTNGFDEWIGFKVEEGFQCSISGNPCVGNRPLQEGWNLITIRQKSGDYFQLYYVKAWSKTNCVRILLGWKIFTYPKVGEIKKYSFNFNPFMGYSK